MIIDAGGVNVLIVGMLYVRVLAVHRVLLVDVGFGARCDLAFSSLPCLGVHGAAEGGGREPRARGALGEAQRIRGERRHHQQEGRRLAVCSVAAGAAGLGEAPLCSLDGQPCHGPGLC